VEAAVAVIFQQGRVLLIQRRDIPVWVLPGGGIEPGETPEQAIVREVLEETGYSVKIKRKVAAYEPVNWMTKPTHFFECEILSGEMKITAESKGIDFFAIDKLPKLIAPPYAGWILLTKLGIHWNS